MSTEDRTLIQVSLKDEAGNTVIGVNGNTFETISGREMTATGDKYRPGVGQTERAFGGPKSFSDLVISRTYLEDRDGPVYKHLISAGSRVFGTVTETPLDADYQGFGAPTTWPVRLQGVKRPDADINSGNRSVLELTFWVDGDPT